MADRPTNPVKEWFKSVDDIPGPYSWKYIFQNDNGSVVISSSDFDKSIIVTIRTGETHSPYGDIGRSILFNFETTSSWYTEIKNKLILDNLNTIIDKFVEELTS